MVKRRKRVKVLRLPKVRKKFAPEKVLAGWREMRQAIPYMSEVELKIALSREMDKPIEDRRNDIVLHLHRRYSKLRQKRELAELLSSNEESRNAA